MQIDNTHFKPNKKELGLSISPNLTARISSKKLINGYNSRGLDLNDSQQHISSLQEVKRVVNVSPNLIAKSHAKQPIIGDDSYGADLKWNQQSKPPLQKDKRVCNNSPYFIDGIHTKKVNYGLKGNHKCKSPLQEQIMVCNVSPNLIAKIHTKKLINGEGSIRICLKGNYQSKFKPPLQGGTRICKNISVRAKRRIRLACRIFEFIAKGQKKSTG